MDFEAPKSRWWWMLVFLVSGLALGCRKDTAAGAALREATPPETQSDSQEAASREGPHPSQRLAGVSPVPIKLVPRQISAVAMGGDSQRALHGDPWSLFDGDATKAFGTEGQPVRVTVKLAEKGALDGMTVYGRAEGSLSILTEVGSELAPVAGLSELNLRDVSADRSNRFSAASPKDAEAVVLEWHPDHPGASLAELELWGTGESSAARPDQFRADQLLTGIPRGAIEAAGLPRDVSVSRPEAAADPRSGTVRVELENDPRTLVRAFLVYELVGLTHWSAAVREINGQPARGGARLATAAASEKPVAGVQVEEIAAAWLRRGTNEFHFRPVNDDDPVGYRVIDLRVIGLPDTGDAVAELETSAAQRTDLGALFDGKLDTGLNVGIERSRRPFELTLAAHLGRLRSGQVRSATEAEFNALKALVGISP